MKRFAPYLISLVLCAVFFAGSFMAGFSSYRLTFPGVAAVDQCLSPTDTEPDMTSIEYGCICDAKAISTFGFPFRFTGYGNCANSGAIWWIQAIDLLILCVLIGTTFWAFRAHPKNM